MQDWASVLERDVVGVLSLNKFWLSLFPSNHPTACVSERIFYYGLHGDGVRALCVPPL